MLWPFLRPYWKRSEDDSILSTRVVFCVGFFRTICPEHLKVRSWKKRIGIGFQKRQNDENDDRFPKEGVDVL